MSKPYSRNSFDANSKYFVSLAPSFPPVHPTKGELSLSAWELRQKSFVGDVVDGFGRALEHRERNDVARHELSDHGPIQISERSAAFFRLSQPSNISPDDTATARKNSTLL